MRQGRVDLFLETPRHLAHLGFAHHRRGDQWIGGHHCLDVFRMQLVARHHRVGRVVRGLDEALPHGDAAWSPVVRRASLRVDAPCGDAKCGRLGIHRQVNDPRGPKVRLPEELRLCLRLGEAVEYPALPQAVDLVQAPAHDSAELLVAHPLRWHLLLHLALLLLALAQKHGQVHVDEAVALGQSLALRRPARAASSHDADPGRAQWGVGVRPDVQVAHDNAVDVILLRRQ
mmetsp:Transcript_53386/g.114774  ORF Transcript_53386/g.114774 Transcript_53386/m.114774 type:complete len:230 (-) Transcript_53386:790-1479(-)